MSLPRYPPQKADQEICVLCLEDVSADVIMLNHALREGGLRFRSKRVDTREAFLRELDDDPPDVILSDHGLPAFDGFAALAITREKYPDVPFIFVTSSLGEQKTIEMFQSGVTDCVLKSQLSKLAGAVRQALENSEQKTRSRQHERELRESEECYRRLVEYSPEAILVVTADDLIVFANVAAAKLLGVAGVKELIGKITESYFRADLWDALITRIRRHWKEQLFFPFVEQTLFCPDGTAREVEVSAAPIVFRGIPAVLVMAHDITERKQALEKLRHSEALKTAILETALDAVLSVDHEGKIQEWNPAAEKIFGYTRAQTIGASMDKLIVPPVMWEVYQDGLTNYLMTGAGSLIGRPVELYLRRSDDSEFRAELAISRVPTEEPPRCTVLIRDITERKQAEARLRQSSERLRLLIAGVKDYAIYMLDPEGKIISWNAGAERITGFRAHEIIGQSFATFFTPEDIAAKLPDQALAKARTQDESDYEGWRVHKDGSRFWIQGIITAMRDDEGRLYGFSKIARDITQQREAEQEIRRLNEQLEQRVRERTLQLEAANQELESFSYSVSHDLRAPLRHIAGYVEILQGEIGAQLNETGRHHLQVIAQSARNLGELIDALLAFSRMGRTEMRQQPVNLAALVKEARRELRPEAGGRAIAWEVGQLPEIQGDPLMLRQVIINLIANALKYTRKCAAARIEIGATETAEEITFFVRDNGVGFDMKYADKLFGVFQRLHGDNEFEGIGIGLANVRRIIHRHGGRTWAEGTVNRGATFFLSLPRVQKPKL